MLKLLLEQVILLGTRFAEAPRQRDMEFCGKQAIGHAAISIRQALNKQPWTERKPPTLTPAVLALLERIQREKQTSSETPKKTKKSRSISAGRRSSGKSGQGIIWKYYLERRALLDSVEFTLNADIINIPMKNNYQKTPITD
ncbi:uncharacterized protein GJ701_001642 [Geothlypis trichas]